MKDNPRWHYDPPKKTLVDKIFAKLDSDDPKEAIPAWLCVYIPAILLIIAGLNELRLETVCK
jgi:hypothetical protein